IYGHGKEAAALRALAEELGLHNRVRLMGTFTPIDSEWVKGSIAAVTSDLESFGLTIVEAMNCGLPVVSTACPHGPPEIITDGVDGLLTEPGDIAGYAAGLRRLMADPALRHTMSQAARKTADRYSPGRVGAEYDELFGKLLRAKRNETITASRPPTAAPTATDSVSCQSESFGAVTLRLPEISDPVALVRDGDRVEVPTTSATATIVDQRLLGDLTPGVWVVHFGDAPAPAGRVDSRALVEPPDTVPDTIVVPFGDNGRLSLRVWRQPGYAEVETVDWSDDNTVTVTGRLYGTPADPDATVATLRARKDASRTHDVTVNRVGDRFDCTIDVAPLIGHPGDPTTLWDLALRPGDGTELRVGKVLDDIAQRKKSHRFPRAVHRKRQIQPYFTINNELSIKVSDAD
ncbi:MAG: glycosyltransferase, partial [Stackebrandtia sp.]